MSKKRKIKVYLIILLLCIVTIGGTAYYYYNANKVENKTPIGGTFVERDNPNFSIGLGDVDGEYLYSNRQEGCT